MSFHVAFDARAEKELFALDKPIRELVIKKIADLREGNFSGDKTLKGKHAGKFRKRAGDYRIIYLREGEFLLVTIIRVAHRREVY